MLNNAALPLRETFKIGLLVDSQFVLKHVHDLAQWGQNQERLHISHLIIIDENRLEVQPAFRIGQYFKTKISKFIITAETLRLTKKQREDCDTYFDLTKTIPNIIMINQENSLNEILLASLDLLIMLGTKEIDAPLLEMPRIGVLSCSYGENNSQGMLEVVRQKNGTLFYIHQLSNRPEKNKTLFTGRFLTRNNTVLNQSQLYIRSNYYLMKLLTDTALNDSLPVFKDQHINSATNKIGIDEQIDYCFRLFVQKLKSKYLPKLRSRWGVAFCRTNWPNIAMSKSIKIHNPPNCFLADPFVISEDNRDYCFVEDYDYETKKGSIAVYELHENSSTRLGVAICEPFHLSFPLIFRFDSKIFMVPESAQNKDIRLYESVTFPLEWKLSTILMSNVSAADTMIFEYQGLWWLFSNINPLGFGDHSSELCIYYSVNLVTNDWKPHKKNPVIIDPSKARNGGILTHNGDTYRVAQFQGYNQYGKGFTINKIETLTINEYKETQVSAVDATFFRNLSGTHHFHSNGKLTVFDYLKYERR